MSDFIPVERPDGTIDMVHKDAVELERIAREAAALSPPPSQQLLDNIPKILATEYQRHRAPEYPPITDQLDALWKGGEAAAEMLAKVNAVKAKYPKP